MVEELISKVESAGFEITQAMLKSPETASIAESSGQGDTQQQMEQLLRESINKDDEGGETK